MNFSVLATPAEGLSGRFTRMDRRKYGIIPGVTDNDYYVNSFHVDVKEPITITEKIKREAPFHAITRGGHITYVELDGEAQKNVKAIAKIVKVMHDEGIGYGSSTILLILVRLAVTKESFTTSALFARARI